MAEPDDPSTEPHAPPAEQTGEPERRTFLATAARVAMTGGLVGSYGTFAAMAARYLYPAAPPKKAFVLVSDLRSFAVGTSRPFRDPTGATIVIARHGDTGGEEDFVALSSTCPHLGCRVNFQAEKHRFFCPCHNGSFDPLGTATGGPPFDAGQSLPRYPLRVDDGLLFIEVPTEKLT